MIIKKKLLEQNNQSVRCITYNVYLFSAAKYLLLRKKNLNRVPEFLSESREFSLIKNAQ